MKWLFAWDAMPGLNKSGRASAGLCKFPSLQFAFIHSFDKYLLSTSHMQVLLGGVGGGKMSNVWTLPCLQEVYRQG